MSDGSVSQADLLASLERLRGAGPAARLDPMRLHYLQALAQRMVAAPDPVQALLEARLQQGLAGLEASQEVPLQDEVPALAPTRPNTQAARGGASTPRPATPLGQLNRYIAEATRAAEAGSASGAGGPRDLRSARRFRETWALISAESQVERAVHRGPENAGPLNAHSLMLRTLGLMRELSPDYLRRFLAHADTLLWLEQAYGALKQPTGKGGAARARKAVRPTK
jgi:hypothetical protein